MVVARIVTLVVFESGELGEKEVKDVLENTSYPNHCFSPRVMDIKSVIIPEPEEAIPEDAFLSIYKQLEAS